MNLDEIEKAYNRLSMIHSETMLENIELRKQLKSMSERWPQAFIYWVKIKLGIVKWWE